MVGTSSRFIMMGPNNIAPRPPKAPAMTVLRMICGTLSVAARVLPPLNPIQPTQMMNTPSAASGSEWLRKGAPDPSNRPVRGPMIITAARLTQPAMEWTTVPPAKSTNPSAASQPGSPPNAPPQAQ